MLNELKFSFSRKIIFLLYPLGFSTADKTWLPVADGYETLNAEVQIASQRSHLKVYQALADLRQDKVFRYGRYDSLAMNQDVFVFRRYNLFLIIELKEKIELRLIYS